MLLSTTTQASIIAALLDDRPVDVDPADLSPPWSDYYDFVAAIVADEIPIQRWLLLCEECRYRDMQDSRRHDRTNFGLISDARGDQLAHYPPVEEILADLPPLRWLWPGWIPRGLLSLLAAAPGTGKSYLALDLCHRICAGSHRDGRFPDDVPIAQPGPCLYVDAENTPQIFKKRLLGWAPEELRRLYLMLPETARMMLNLSEFEDRDRLLDMAYRIRPQLVVVDSFGATTLKGENAKEDVMALLSFLSRLALDYETALLLIHHLRKRSSAQVALPATPMTIDAIRGSSHIPAVARNVLGLQWASAGVDFDPNGPRVLRVIKSNLDRYPPPIGVWFDSHPDDPSVARLRYGEPPRLEQEPRALDACVDWLLHVLEAEGPLSPAEVVELAKYESYSERTVYRARKALGDRVANTRGWRAPGNGWALAEQREEA